MRFKSGDKVRVKSLSWYNKNKDSCGCIYMRPLGGQPFNVDMSKLCGKVATIERTAGSLNYTLEGHKGYWRAFMFEYETCNNNTFETLLDIFWKDYRTFLLKKDKEYGSSYLNPLNKLITLSPEDRIKARLEEKIGRLLNGSDKEDTYDDILGLLVHLKIVQKK